MWNADGIYYMSDNGPDKRSNLWKHDLSSKINSQLTHFKEFDITFPESGSSDIIFEAGGKLYLYNLTSASTMEIAINIISDQKALIAQQKKVTSSMHDATISPGGKRVVIEARGELFNLPATEGYVSNISGTSGSAERKPSWSPDGKYVAYWSDASGEYQLVLKDMTSDAEPKTITKLTSGFNYTIYWSPDSKKIIYVDQSMRINCLDVESGKIAAADKDKYMFEGALRNFSVAWSPDSKWATYSRSDENRSSSAIFLYNVSNNKATQLTSGYYADHSPVYSTDGKHLFYVTGRNFNPVYSDLDNTFIYPNSCMIAVGTLDKSTSSILEIKNDEEEDAEEKDDKTKLL